MNKPDNAKPEQGSATLVVQGETPSRPPLCSVCIANFNGMAVIDACIGSVLAQDCGFPVEIIVHDDASTDGSVDHIRRHYPQVILLVGSENAGFCISNNRMASIARGEFILLLNNDAALLPDALRTLHDVALGLNRPAILGLPQYDANTGVLIDIGSTFDFFLNPVPNRDRGEREIGMVIGACLWITRGLWRELGGFPPWFGSLAEDTYLCCLARLHGHIVRAVPHSGFRHWVGNSLGGGKVVQNRIQSKASRRVASERNKNFVIALLYPAPIYQLLMPVHALLLLAEGIVLALIKWDRSIFTSIYLGSLKALWANRAMLRDKRQQIQASRRIDRRRFFSVFQVFPHKLKLLFSYGLPDIR